MLATELSGIGVANFDLLDEDTDPKLKAKGELKAC
jgi:hypothetical protein